MRWTWVVAAAWLGAGLGCTATSGGTEPDCGGEACASPRRCVANSCRSTCRGDSECRNGQRCNTDGLCEEDPAATSSSSSTGGTTSSQGARDAGPPLGGGCEADADCASGMCRAVYAGSSLKVCVRTCAQAGDCGNATAYCSPVNAGATTGLCVPRSPTHCMACDADADCGLLGETCAELPGTGARACFVDCALDGAQACPPQYTCSDVGVGGRARRLCTPDTGSCGTALGGFCDAINTPQPCDSSSDAGHCTGMRTCQAGNRYSTCSAAAPNCRGSCAAANPPGCLLDFCAGVATTADHCGTCGMPCPGRNQPSALAACTNQACSFGCVGENYDVNAAEQDGCELLDIPADNHTQPNAQYVAELGCGDGDSMRNMTGKIPSDARTHTPAVQNVGVAGAAPDWFRIRAAGGLTCVNDVNMALQVNNTTAPQCFHLSVKTDEGDYNCTTNTTGFCSISNGSGSYSGDTDIFLVVAKTCSSPGPEGPDYVINGHL